MKDVSVIMPAYNSEKTIESAIMSVLQQKISIELIIIDDCSTDSTYKICQEIEKNNKEVVRLYKNEKKGVSSARNLGLKKAKGKYILFLDSDDRFIEDSLEKMNSLIEEVSFDWIIFGYNRHMVSNGKNHLTCPVNEVIKRDDFKRIIEELQSKSLFNQIWNKLYIKKILDDNNIIFDENLSLGEDYLFNIEYIDKIETIACYEKTVYWYNSTQNGLNFKYVPNKLMIKIDNLKKLDELYVKNAWDREYIDGQYVYTCLSGIANIVSNSDKKIIKDEIDSYISNQTIHNDLDAIYSRCKKVSLKVLIRFIKQKNSFIIKSFGYFILVIKKCYRKFKYE